MSSTHSATLADFIPALAGRSGRSASKALRHTQARTFSGDGIFALFCPTGPCQIHRVFLLLDTSLTADAANYYVFSTLSVDGHNRGWVDHSTQTIPASRTVVVYDQDNPGVYGPIPSEEDQFFNLQVSRVGTPAGTPSGLVVVEFTPLIR